MAIQAQISILPQYRYNPGIYTSVTHPFPKPKVNITAKAFKTLKNFFLTHLSDKNSYAICVAEPMKTIRDDSLKRDRASKSR